MDTMSFKRPLMISLAVMLMLVAGSWLLDITITIMVCMLAIAWQVVRLLYYAVRRNARGLKLTGMRLLLWMAVVLGVGQVMGHYAAQGREKGEALFAARQAYRTREGRYPDTLDALRPRDIATVPVLILRPGKEQPFHYRFRDNHFRLMYSYAFRIGYEYDSKNGKWEALD